MARPSLMIALDRVHPIRGRMPRGGAPTFTTARAALKTLELAQGVWHRLTAGRAIRPAGGIGRRDHRAGYSLEPPESRGPPLAGSARCAMRSNAVQSPGRTSICR